MRYQYWQGKKNLWCWHLAGDGQVLAHGEGYADKPEMLRAIEVSKRSRPGDGDVRQSQRYRFSIAAVMAMAAAGLCLWTVFQVVGPRWDGSYVTVDADVVRMFSHGKGKHRSDYLTVRFDTLEGRSVTTTISNATADFGAKTTRVRYAPGDAKVVMLDSTAMPYIGSMAILVGAWFFLWLAYKASLHDGQDHFM